MAVSDTRKYNRGEKKGQWRPKSEWSNLPWRVNYPHPGTKSGRANQSFATKEEAKAFDANKRVERHRGVHVDEKAGQQLVEVYIWEWLASVNLKSRSLSRYELAINKHILPFFGKMRMIEVQRTDVNTWVKQKVQAGYAPAGVRLMYAVLAGMFKAAVIDQVRAATPCVKIGNLPPLPKRSSGKKRKWLPTHPQVMALIRAFAPRLRLAILVGASCGLRYGEVMGLTVEDFDLQNRVVRVRRQLSEQCGTCRRCMQTTKSPSSVRDVDMPTSVADAVRAHIAAGFVRTLTMTDHTVEVRPGEPPATRQFQMMFLTAAGKPITRSPWGQRWWAAVTAAGEILADAPRGRNGFTFHTLRHSFASLLIAGGANVVEVQEAMGHADPTTTLNEYVWPTGRRTALALVDATFNDGEIDLAA